MSSIKFKAYLEKLHTAANIQHRRFPHSFGYPMNMHQIEQLQQVREACIPYHVLNNCLDTFASEQSHWKAHSAKQERDLIVALAEPWRIGPHQHLWGYVGNGGTEGNAKGIRTGLEAFKHQKKLILFSNDAHISGTFLVHCAIVNVRYLN